MSSGTIHAKSIASLAILSGTAHGTADVLLFFVSVKEFDVIIVDEAAYLSLVSASRREERKKDDLVVSLNMGTPI